MISTVANQVRDVAVHLSALTPEQAAKIIEKATPEQIEQAKREMAKMATMVEGASALTNIALALTLLFGAANAANAAEVITEVKKQESIPAAQVKAKPAGAKERAEKKLKQMLQQTGADTLLAQMGIKEAKA